VTTNGDQGCPVMFPSEDSYGPAFNHNGGGWYIFCACYLSVRVLTQLKYLGMWLNAHQPTIASGSGRGTPEIFLQTLKMVVQLLVLATGYVSSIPDFVALMDSFQKDYSSSSLPQHQLRFWRLRGSQHHHQFDTLYVAFFPLGIFSRSAEFWWS